MKRLNERQKKYQQRVSTLRFRRRTHLRKKRQKERDSSIGPQPVYDTTIVAPSRFNLAHTPSRTKLLRFIRRLRVAVKTPQAILLDFSNTSKMISDGTLLFRASLCKAIADATPQTVIRCKLSDSDKINQVLKQLGVLDTLKNETKIEPVDSDVVHWRFAQGTRVIGEKYEDILGHYEGTVAEPLVGGLYDGIVEAMTNTRQHAYPDGVPDTHWWMFSQERDGRLFVAFCDLGKGIPGSLPANPKKRDLWSRITAKFGVSPKDSIVIDEAIKHSQTRTGKHYRGKGLKQLSSVLDDANDSSLYLFSNRGCYKKNNRVSSLTDYSTSIGGTLIQWSLELPNPETLN